MKKVTICVRLDADLKERLHALSKRQNRSAANLIATGLGEWADQCEIAPVFREFVLHDMARLSALHAYTKAVDEIDVRNESLIPLAARARSEVVRARARAAETYHAMCAAHDALIRIADAALATAIEPCASTGSKFDTHEGFIDFIATKTAA
jgi:hypothetical protein